LLSALADLLLLLLLLLERWCFFSDLSPLSPLSPLSGLLSLAVAPAGWPSLAATVVAAVGAVTGVGWTAGAVGVATTGGDRFEITMAIVVPTRTTSKPTTPTMIQTNWGTELC
jgi:hypothetical protein